MQFSGEEMLFFNSVTKGETPFGVFLQVPSEEEVEAYQKTVVTTLQEKGILDENGEISKLGTAVLFAWEAYRNCKKHLIFNRLCLGLLSEKRVVGMVRVKGGYEVFVTNPEAIVAGLLKRYEFLRLGNTRGNYEMKKLPYREWAREVESYGENLLTYGEYLGQESQQEGVYYWKGEIGYHYDFNTGYRRQMESREMRLQILRSLGVRKEQSNGGRISHRSRIARLHE